MVRVYALGLLTIFTLPLRFNGEPTRRKNRISHLLYLEREAEIGRGRQGRGRYTAAPILTTN